VAAWKRHVIYNIAKWTVDWIKDQLALLLPGTWATMPRWKHGKLAWSVYTYVTVGLSDGVDFAKRAKKAAAMAKKRKRDDTDVEAAPPLLQPFQLPALRDDQAWEEGVLDACLSVITELAGRFGTVDFTKKDTGGIVSKGYAWITNQFYWLRFLSSIRNGDDEKKKFALCPLYNWKRAFITVDTTLLFHLLNDVKEDLALDPDMPALPTSLPDWSSNASTVREWNDYLFVLSPNKHRSSPSPVGKERRKEAKRGRRAAGIPPQAPAQKSTDRVYSYCFATNGHDVSVLFGKRTRVKDDDEEEEMNDGDEEEKIDINGSGKRTGTGAWVGDIDKIPDELFDGLESLPDGTTIVSIDPGVVSPVTGVRSTLGDLRQRASANLHPLDGLDSLDSFNISANNVRKYTRAKEQAETTEALLIAALGSREVFTTIGSARTTAVAAITDHLTRLFVILDRVWEVTLSADIARSRWHSYVASQKWYAKTVPRLILGPDTHPQAPVIVCFGAATFSTVRRGRMPVSVRKMRRAIVRYLRPELWQFFLDIGEDYSSQMCSTSHSFNHPSRPLMCVKHDFDHTPKPAHGLQLCHSETECE